jgi:hypothetical protein
MHYYKDLKDDPLLSRLHSERNITPELIAIKLYLIDGTPLSSTLSSSYSPPNLYLYL